MLIYPFNFLLVACCFVFVACVCMLVRHVHNMTASNRVANLYSQ